ncbi:MAG: hypothetical protein K6T81_05230 [Alicyclobacillus macrosporangiidus]|uniref:hypothetical protein n=1 Tax=Alicyclobacillus macrosporangiidus TaxID=392015 RepID=UPI0026F2A73B|nr:hypothetical protein [Alicyclobacillus macrosporangiidus]MCL6598125.1 hypothetical protein [Alicyclobacillus macrosporangiidus]
MEQEAKAALNFVQYCAHCGHSLADPRNLVNVYSHTGLAVCFWWCHSCGAKGEAIQVDRVTSTDVMEEAAI